jgi:hypothetical protein
MACLHKFQEDLNLTRINFEPTTLIVGTFNPSWPEGNKAEWYYGRFDNNFWDVLPRLYSEESLRCATPAIWKSFCERHKIAITDLISCIEDAEPENELHKSQLRTFSDKAIAEKFTRHTPVGIVELLRSNPTIKNIYLTRGISETFWKNHWKPVELYASQNSLHERKLLTPSGYAFYQQAKYNKQNPAATLNLEDYILKDWQEKWHPIEII